MQPAHRCVAPRMVGARASYKNALITLLWRECLVRAAGALIALAFDERHVDASLQDRVQLDFDLQGVDQRLRRLAYGSLPRDVERFCVVIQGFEHLEQVAPRAFDVAFGQGTVSFRLGCRGG